MRYPQILLSITFLVLGSTIQAGDRPASAPPIDERLTGIESRLDNHETRINALEGKCNCAVTGKCTCTPENCECKDCPEHTKYPQLGTTENVRILAFHADWCGPCQTAKAEAEQAGVADKVILYDFDRDTKAARMCGVTQIPTLVLVKDEKVIARHFGSVGYAAKIKAWLAGERTGAGVKEEPRRRSAPSAPVYYRPTYYQPRTYFRPTYGGCATCR